MKQNGGGSFGDIIEGINLLSPRMIIGQYAESFVLPITAAGHLLPIICFIPAVPPAAIRIVPLDNIIRILQSIKKH